MKPLRWGIVSAGNISHDFCAAFSTLPQNEHQLVSVGARSIEKAEKFANLHNIPRFYGSYEEVISDENVDVVYIGTINPLHLHYGKLTLESGKHLLCEKPLCVNVKETKELIECAKKCKRFLMEAIWSRSFPISIRLRQELAKGTIGDPLQVIAYFCMFTSDRDRVRLNDMGGGTVLDIGIYTIQFASLVFGGEKPVKIISGGHINEYGVDVNTSTTIIYPNGKTATLITHSNFDMPCEAWAIGTKGIIKLPNPFWCGEDMELPSGEKLHFPLPEVKMKMFYPNSNGLCYQCPEVRRCIQNGMIESQLLPHKETLLIAEIMESIRKQVGVVYKQDI